MAHIEMVRCFLMMIIMTRGAMSEKLTFGEVWNQASKTWELDQIPSAYDGDILTFYSTGWDAFGFLAFDLQDSTTFVSGVQLQYAGGGNTVGSILVGKARVTTLSIELISAMSLCTSLTSPASTSRGCTFQCPSGTVGQYVYIVMNDADLKVFEVEIYGGKSEVKMLVSTKCTEGYVWLASPLAGAGVLPDTTAGPVVTTDESTTVAQATTGDAVVTTDESTTVAQATTGDAVVTTDESTTVAQATTGDAVVTTDESSTVSRSTARGSVLTSATLLSKSPVGTIGATSGAASTALESTVGVASPTQTMPSENAASSTTNTTTLGPRGSRMTSSTTSSSTVGYQGTATAGDGGSGTASAISSGYHGNASTSPMVPYTTANDESATINDTMLVNITLSTPSFGGSEHSGVQPPAPAYTPPSTAADESTTAVYTSPSTQVNESTPFTSGNCVPAAAPGSIELGAGGIITLPDIPCVFGPAVSNSVSHVRRTANGLRLTLYCVCQHEFADTSTAMHVTCLNSGHWSHDVGNCIKQECPLLPLYEHAYLDARSAAVLEHVTFSCHIGYELPDGSITRSIVCPRTKSWSSVPPDCQPKRCPPMAPVPDTVITGTSMASGTRYEGQLEVTCPAGMLLSNGLSSQSVRCLSSGRWSADVTGCSADHCPPMPYIRHARARGSAQGDPPTVHVQCDEGFSIPDGQTWFSLACVRGSWMGAENQCSESFCLEPPSLPGSLSDSSGQTKYGDGQSVTYTCEEGLRASDGSRNFSLVCSESEGIIMWLPHDQQCRADRCPPPVIPHHSRPSITGHTTVGIRVPYSCSLGYAPYPDASMVLVCGEDRQWHGQVQCEAVRCPPPPSGNHTLSTHDLTSWTYGQALRVTCDTGYWVADNVYETWITCDEHGTWGSNFTGTLCKLVMCGQHPVVTYSTATATGQTVRDSIEYTCQYGFRFPSQYSNDSLITQCSAAGVWEPPVPSCTAIRCLSLAVWSGIVPNTTDNTYGTRVNYTCEDSYWMSSLDPHRALFCNISGDWAPPVMDCIDSTVFAPPPPTEAPHSQDVGAFALLLLAISVAIVPLLDIMSSVDRYVTYRKGLKKKDEGKETAPTDQQSTATSSTCVE